MQGPVGASQPGYDYDYADSSIQSDGRLLTFAQVDGPSGTNLEALRFLANGQLDSSFGSNGSTIVGSGKYSRFIAQTAAGTIFALSQNAVYELNSSGQLNSSFGTNGSVTFPQTESITTAAIDGSDLLVGDNTANSTGQITRFEPDGSLDSSFGTAGSVTIPKGISSLLVNPAGKIIAMGGSILYQFNNDGSADTSFGQAGQLPELNAYGLLPELGTNGQIYVWGRWLAQQCISPERRSILDGEQVLVTSFKRLPTPKSGKKRLIDLSINSLPKTLPAGVYHLLVQIVDPTGATSVVATDQTVTVVAPVIQPTVTVTPVTNGNTAKRGTVLVTVTNDGNIAAKGIRISLMTTPQGSGPVSSPLAMLKSSTTLMPKTSKNSYCILRDPARSLSRTTHLPGLRWVVLLQRKRQERSMISKPAR